MRHEEDCLIHGNPVKAVIDGPFTEGRLAIAPHYSVLRRAIGQLGGLLLLYRTVRKTRVEEIAASLEGVSAEWREAHDGLRAIAPAPRMRRIHGEVLAAAELIATATEILRGSLRATGGGVEAADAALAPLQRAQRILLAVSDDRLGMGMVSYDTACCCSAPAEDTPTISGGGRNDGGLFDLGA
ncbi:MAG TPA: hypothetical protein VHA10_21745 [Hypericibacter adhaerens]|jgi:hypothetical protein|uniref:Uncharacterized protein n=1 Tax=Hypericibacter adhaerens TaxID=2602016 RepID=A0A5J6N487_9PROT|nr:hypothetical protein [Hypericibacter adhaerens]QEX24649.1 hypothetical protein FRZ61_45900 [Hypericibacter adhaerens]HWA45859.1 hypothetical protein [Hypericibacter adhaerens]